MGETWCLAGESGCAYTLMVRARYCYSFIYHDFPQSLAT